MQVDHFQNYSHVRLLERCCGGCHRAETRREIAPTWSYRAYSPSSNLVSDRWWEQKKKNLQPRAERASVGRRSYVHEGFLHP